MNKHSKTSVVYRFPLIKYQKAKYILKAWKLNSIIVLLTVFIITGAWQAAQIKETLRDSRDASSRIEALHMRQERLLIELEVRDADVRQLMNTSTINYEDLKEVNILKNK